jgi:putative salt-induced outer membrane protein
LFTIRSIATIKPILAITAVITLAAPATALAQAAPPKPVTSFTGDLGYVDATGNTSLSTLSVGDKIVHTDGKWTVTQLASYVYGETNALVTANQFRVEGRVDFDLIPRFGVFGGGSYERNTFAGFTSRTDEIAGLRWKAIVAPMDSLNVDAGGVATQESDVDGTTKSYPAARLAAAYKHRFSKTAYFQQLGEYIPDLQTSGSYRANSESSLVAPISSHVGIKVSYSIRYDSRPPVKFGTTDRLLTTGVQISY